MVTLPVSMFLTVRSSLVSSVFVDDAHAAFAGFFQDFVVENGFTDHLRLYWNLVLIR